ncbi:MAG: hypothetical protein ABT03_12470 [Comamonas sp. SCN 67-35]|nr:MAG: hypothetical protein ABT03_12470 [Comamonas sp. SCN 67-35]OJX02426.1 MAG: hypothetical protein BGO73_04295 [Burkholderiales bacterium 66-26]
MVHRDIHALTAEVIRPTFSASMCRGASDSRFLSLAFSLSISPSRVASLARMLPMGSRSIQSGQSFF